MLVSIMGNSDIAVSLTVASTTNTDLSSVTTVDLVVLRVVGMAYPLDDGVEALVWVRVILHYSSGAVGLFEGVGTLKVVSVAVLLLLLLVSSMRIVDTIFKFVVGWTLKFNENERRFIRSFLDQQILTLSSAWSSL